MVFNFILTSENLQKKRLKSRIRIMYLLKAYVQTFLITSYVGGVSYQVFLTFWTVKLTFLYVNNRDTALAYWWLKLMWNKYLK